MLTLNQRFYAALAQIKRDAEEDEGEELTDLPEEDYPEEIESAISSWNETVPEPSQGILEAKDNFLISGVIAAGILLAAWLYDRRKNRYLKPQNREVLAEDDLRAMMGDRIDQAKDRLNRKSPGTAWDEIRNLHTEAYLLGRGGASQMGDDDYRNLDEILKFQKSRLRVFQDAAGGLSEGASRNRLSMYATSAESSFNAGREAAAIAAGFKYAQRFLSPAENCPDCLKYAGMGKRAIGVLPVPKTQSRCMINCLCRMKYYK